jgi:hypothetical protein
MEKPRHRTWLRCGDVKTTLRNPETLVMVQFPYAAARPKCLQNACQLQTAARKCDRKLPTGCSHSLIAEHTMSEIFPPGEQAAAQTATRSSEICMFAWGHSSPKLNISTFPHVPHLFFGPKSFFDANPIKNT